MSVEGQSSGAPARSALLRARPVAARLLRRFLALSPSERSRLYALTLVIGVVCGLVAVAFHSAIRAASQLLIERAVGQEGGPSYTWLLLTPTLGALVCGLLLEYALPKARGSGIPQVKLIYAVRSGRLRLRDGLGKFAVATLQLGTGSSLGREGPTVQICASVASALGRLFAISPGSLRRLIPVGAAAGIAAAFNAPIAAVTFTIEELVGDLDQTVLSGVVVAAALAAAVEHSVLGGHPVFYVPGNYQLQHSSSLLVYALLGAAAALLSWVFYAALLGLRAQVLRRSRGVRAVAPAFGALATALIAVLVLSTVHTPGVLGDGYATLSAALLGYGTLVPMAVLVVAKLLGTVACYASGGAGGIFAPVLFIGGMLGGVFGHLDRLLLAHPAGELGAFALVGMGAFFAAVIRAPITSVLIIFEMTRGYGLILPLMIASTVAYALARALTPVPIYEALLEQDGLHLPQTQRTAQALSALFVRDAMTTELVSLHTTESVAAALARVLSVGHSIYPVLTPDGHYGGFVSEARLRRASAEGRDDSEVGALARREQTLSSDLPLVEAVAQMGALGARQLVVLDPASQRPVGMLALSDVVRAHGLVASADGAPPQGARAAVQQRARDTSVPVVRTPPG